MLIRWAISICYKSGANRLSDRYGGQAGNGSRPARNALVLEDFRQEAAGPVRAWGAEELFGLHVLDDLATIHEHNAVGHFAGKAHFMGDAHHGHALAGQLDHDVQHFVDHFRVERRGWFIEQHGDRVHGPGPGNGDPLLLTQTIILFQDTSLVYVLSIADFTGAASKFAQRDGRLVELYLFVALVYLVICYLLSSLSKRLKTNVGKTA